MFPTHEIAQSRDHTLNNLRDFSSALFDASHRFSELFSSASRDALHHGSRQWSMFGHGQLDAMTQLPATWWLESSARTSRLLDAAFEIVGETHKAMIRSAETQVRVFDEMVFATIQHAEKGSPWEAEVALQAMRSTLETAETTLRGMSAAAIETVELAEQESHQLAASSPVEPPARRRSAKPRGTR